MKYSEKWGDSIDIAVDLALADLGLTRDQVTVTVLEEPSKGFFGIGSKLAKVRVEEIVKEEPKPAKAEVMETAAAAEKEEAPGQEPAARSEERKPRRERKRSSRRRERKPSGAAREAAFSYGEAAGLNERPDDLTEQEDHPAKEFLVQLAKEMGLDISIKVSANETCVYIDIDGPDSGTIIGKRGQTLDAVQYLTSLVVNKGESSYIRVVVDAEGYRQRREKTLEKLANRLADKVATSSRSVRLEPMNPYERKVIHTALQSRPEVTTRSEGEEPYRRVIIEASK